ncbi:MAG: arginase family protein [Chitinophagales bacterium]|jgi:arginase family enzyme|nr:arginase family protein [Chitinophagales bacterium]
MILDFLEAPDFDYIQSTEGFLTHELGHYIKFLDTDLSLLNAAKVFILGVKESRNSTKFNIACELAVEEIRKQLYHLTYQEGFPDILDLGNIINSEKPENTYEILEKVLAYLHSFDAKVIILGGSQDLTIPQFGGFSEFYGKSSLTLIDERIDLRDKDIFDSHNFLSKLTERYRHKLLDIQFLGSQIYFIHQAQIDALAQYFPRLHRLGSLRYAMEANKHHLLNTQVVSFDINVMKQADAPGRYAQTPNGFFSDELAQIFRYLGTSPYMKSLGIYELNPQFDLRTQSILLVAQALWYFLEGVSDAISVENLDKRSDIREFQVENDLSHKPMKFYFDANHEVFWLDLSNAVDENRQYFAVSQKDFDLYKSEYISDDLLHLLTKLSIDI